jgi:hypothetical protein
MYHPCRRMQEYQSFAELQDSLLDLEAHQKVLCSTRRGVRAYFNLVKFDSGLSGRWRTRDGYG